MVSSRLLFSIVGGVAAGLAVGCGGVTQKVNSKSKPTEADFPAMVNVDTIKGSCFVPALENAAVEDKNVIYTPAFLFAWDELRHVLGAFTLLNADQMLSEVDKSTSFGNSLSKGEYDVKVKTTDNRLSITASFSKSLPFAEIMDTTTEPFVFDGVKVKGVGMPNFNSKAAQQIQILYYKDNDHFVICIHPKDAAQEIILAKGIAVKGSLKATLAAVEDAMQLGTRESLKKKFDYKFTWEGVDKVIIPVLRFNLQKSYSNFVGTAMRVVKDYDTITLATQRTAFVLDENGTKVEAVATVEVDAVPAAMEAPPPSQKPKLLLFDKPFVVILHKKEQTQPYLMARVENAELMVKR